MAMPLEAGMTLEREESKLDTQIPQKNFLGAPRFGRMCLNSASVCVCELVRDRSEQRCSPFRVTSAPASACSASGQTLQGALAFVPFVLQEAGPMRASPHRLPSAGPASVSSSDDVRRRR